MAMVQTRVVVAESTWRRAVRRLNRFTISELAAELRCSQRAARDHIKAMMESDPPLVEQCGWLGRKPRYAYIKPTDEGDRFKRERELRVVPPPPEVAAASSAVAMRDNSNIAQSALRDVPGYARALVREAITRGWKLHPANGSSKASLTRGVRMVKIPSTPRNPSVATDQLRQQLFGDPARFRRREAG
jgi:hypothetical protein